MSGDSLSPEREQRVQQRLQRIRHLWLSGVPIKEIATVVRDSTAGVASYLTMVDDDDLVAGLREQLALILGDHP